MNARLYRLAIRLIVPRSLRDEYGDEMTLVFRELCRAERRRRGWIGIARMWFLELRQLTVVAQDGRRDTPDSPAGQRRRTHLRVSPTISWWAGFGRTIREIRHAARALARQPLFTGVAVLVLAVGIGLNAAILSVARATIAAALPFRDADGLAVLLGSFERPYWNSTSALTARELFDYRDRNTVLEDVAVFSLWGNVTWTGDGAAERLRVTFATPAYFRLLRVPAALGRTFGREAGGAELPTVVLSHEFWRRRFAADSTVIGREITLTGRRHTVIGVMPSGFRDMTRWSTVDAWIPLRWGHEVFGADMFETLQAAQFFGLVRFVEGVTLEIAEQELRDIAAELRLEQPRDLPESVRLTPLREYFFASAWKSMRLVFAGAGLVLVMCCVNVGALVLLRGRNRGREIAVRAAIGGSRFRLAQLVLTETTLLAAAGGVLGAVLAHWGVDLFGAVFGHRITTFSAIRLDAPVLMASCGTLLLVALACGLYPAIRASRPRPADALLTRVSTGSLPEARGTSLRKLRFGSIVAVESAVAVVLLVAAGLVARSLHRAANAELGYNAAGLLTMRMDLTASRHAGPAGSSQFAWEFIDGAERLPGVNNVGLLGPDMLGSAARHVRMTPAGRDPTLRENQTPVQWLSVTPGAIGAMGVPLLYGRDLTWKDLPGAPIVAVLGQQVAERFWPGESAVGRRFHLFGDARSIGTVVGVVSEAKHRSRFAADGLAGAAYLSYLQWPTLQVAALIRTNEPGRDVALDGIRRVAARVDPAVPVFDVALMSQRVRGEETLLRMAASLTALYAMLAGLLGFVGTAGLLAYAVRQRRSEIALRAALGARRQTIMKFTFVWGMTPALVGVAAGLTVALGLARVVQGLLFDVRATDPLTYAGVAALVIAAAAVACYLPARTAARVDPMRVLRLE